MKYNKRIFIIMFSIFTIAVLVSFSYAHFVKDDAQGNQITSINMITKSSEDLTNIARVSYNNDNIINIDPIPSQSYSVIYKLKVDYLTTELNKLAISLQNKETNITGIDSTYQVYECNENDYNISTHANVGSLCVLNSDDILNNASQQPVLFHELNTNVTKYYILKINLNNNSRKYFSATIKYGIYKNPYTSAQLMTYTGSYQAFEIPQSGKYKIELWGASAFGSYYGKGAYTSGEVQLSISDQIKIYIGGQGLESSGGYNGGGSGRSGNTVGFKYGGGATDIRINGTTLYDRIMTAGGGGAGYDTNIGHAGGLKGYDAWPPAYPANTATGGTQFSGGTVTNYGCGNTAGASGSFGQGGVGGGASSNGSGGGGGGYYGGAGGSNLCSGSWPAGGGSSFISGHTGCVAVAGTGSTTTRLDSENALCSSTSSIGYNTDPVCSEHYSGKLFRQTLMIDGAGYKWEIIDGALVKTLEAMPNPLGGYYASGIGHTGNGYARITYIGE